MKIKTVFLFVCIPVILLLVYWIVGYSIISNPDFLLKQSKAHEDLARQVFACQNVPLEPPKIYVLPKRTLNFFIFPYKYLGRHVGIEQNYASFTTPEDGAVVLQEDATNDDFFHELGHFFDYTSNPEGYTKKTFREKESFASDFASEVRRKCQH